MQTTRDRHITDILFVLAVALATVFLSLLLIAAGVGVYRNVLRNTQRTYALRTPVAYLTQKVRQHADSGAVRIGALGDAPALFLEEEFGGVLYVTCLYAHDGMLRELFTPKDHPVLSQDAGSGVTELDTLSFSARDGALLIHLSGEGGSCSFVLHCTGIETEDADAEE